MTHRFITGNALLRLLPGLLALLFMADCWGHDSIWTNDAQKMVIDADLGSFPAYTKGSRLTVNFDSRFSVLVHYLFDDTGHIRNLHNVYSTYDVLLPKIGGKWKINNDLNIISFVLNNYEMLINGNITITPMFKKNFKPSQKSGTLTADISVKGSITLELARDLIGGGAITPVNIPLITSYGAVSRESGWPAMDSRTYFGRIELKTSGFIPAPAMCKIDLPGGEHIDFGNVITDSLTPARENENQQAIMLDYRCNAKKTLPVSIHLLARTAAFSNAVIASTNPAVGITLSRNGTPLSPEGKFSTRIENGQGHDTLMAIVTRDPSVAPAAIDTGPFSANAILIMEQE